MKAKSIKLSPKKGGNGYISSYSVNIGSSEANDVGFLDADGKPLPLEKVLDVEHNQIIIKRKDGE
jgi:hypothetical protein